MKTQKQGGRLQAKERGLRRKHPCHHRDLGLSSQRLKDCLVIQKQGPESRLELTTQRPGIKGETSDLQDKRGCQVKARDKRNKHLDFQAMKER